MSHPEFWESWWVERSLS